MMGKREEEQVRIEEGNRKKKKEVRRVAYYQRPNRG